MPIIFRQSKTFRKSFSKLDGELKKKALKKFEYFVNDPFHPSLRIRKMEGKKDIYEGHITLTCVFIFKYYIDDEGNTICEALDIGTHEIYR